MELLEPRRLFANVTAVVRDGTIYLTGSAEADRLKIVGGVDFDASIDGVAGTTINGVSQFFLGTTSKPVIIDFGGGDDTIDIGDGDYWSGEVGILGGKGNDRVMLPSANFRAVQNVFFNGGDGDDTIGMVDRRILGRVLFEGGAGRDRAYLSNVLVTDRLTVYDRNGPTNLTAIDVAVGRSITFDTGNSADRIALTRVRSNGPLVVYTRGGGDIMYLIYRNRFSTRAIDLGDDPNDRYRVLGG